MTQSQVHTPAPSQSRSPALIIGISVASLILVITGIVAMIALFGGGEAEKGDKATAENSELNSSERSNSKTTQSADEPNNEMVRVASLPKNDCGNGVVEYLPKQLVDAASFDVIDFYDAMDPDNNQLIEFLNVLAIFDDEVNIWISDKNRSQLKRIDRGLSNKIYDALGQSFDEFSIDPALLAKTDDAFNRFERLLEGPGSRVPVPPTFEALYPHFQGKREIARILQARAFSAIKAVDETGLLREARLQVGLATYDCRPRLIIGDYVDMAALSMFYSVIENALSRKVLSDKGIVKLQELLRKAEVDRESRGSQSLNMEHLILLNYSVQFKIDPGNRIPAMRRLKLILQGMIGNESTDDSLPPAFVTQFTQMKPEEFDDWINEVNRLYGEYNEAFQEQPIRYLRLLEIARKHEQLCKQVEYQRKYFLNVLLLPNTKSYMIAGARALSDIRGWQCLCTLALWNRRFERPPSSIQELFQEINGSSPPLDPFDGQPIRMLNRDGRLVFFTIGPDGRDEGGQNEWNGGSDSGGDRMYRLPN